MLLPVDSCLTKVTSNKACKTIPKSTLKRARHVSFIIAYFAMVAPAIAFDIGLDADIFGKILIKSLFFEN